MPFLEKVGQMFVARNVTAAAGVAAGAAGGAEL
jgi:hypothetical protein